MKETRTVIFFSDRRETRANDATLKLSFDVVEEDQKRIIFFEFSCERNDPNV